MMLWRARECRYYLFTGLQSLDALTTRMLEFSSKFQLSTSMSMWAQSSFSRNISCSNLIMAIALPSVWPLNVPRTTSPFSTIYQAFLILELLKRPHYHRRKLSEMCQDKTVPLALVLQAHY